MIFTNRKNRYWLYFGLAFFVSMGAMIFIIASILSAGVLPAILILDLVIFAGLSLIAAAAIALIDAYFAIIAKTVVSIIYYLACILYYPICLILICVLGSIELFLLAIFKMFAFVAEYVCSNNFALYVVFALLISLAIGAMVAISILSVGAAPAILAFLSSIAFIGGPISGFIAGMSLIGQIFTFGALASFIALIPGVVIAVVSAGFVSKKNSVYADWIEPGYEYLVGNDSVRGKIDQVLSTDIYGNTKDIMNDCCEKLTNVSSSL